MKIVVYVDGELLAAARRLTGTFEAGALVHRALKELIDAKAQDVWPPWAAANRK
jgi:hypothetical protein